jgi:hypothetical protein
MSPVLILNVAFRSIEFIRVVLLLVRLTPSKFAGFLNDKDLVLLVVIQV